MVEVVEWDAFGHAQFELSLGMQLLESHEAGAAVEIMHTGDAHTPQNRLGVFDHFRNRFNSRVQG